MLQMGMSAVALLFKWRRSLHCDGNCAGAGVRSEYGGGRCRRGWDGGVGVVDPGAFKYMRRITGHLSESESVRQQAPSEYVDAEEVRGGTVPTRRVYRDTRTDITHSAPHALCARNGACIRE